MLERVEHVEALSGSTWRFPPTRVLVVDDAAENRELLSLVLGELGLDVALAGDGREAVTRASEEHFEVILMDIQMPVMDGYEAVHAMRESGRTLPVVALTANAMKGYERRILEAGFSHYHTKPIDVEKLTEMLAPLLGGERVESAEPDASPLVGTLAGARFVERLDERLPERDAALAAADGTRLAASDPWLEGTRVDAVTDNTAALSDPGAHADSPMQSTLLALNPRFRAIVAQFVPKLFDEIAAMDRDLAGAGFDSLARRAHWLKGSGGSVGFAAFTEPAARLESGAKAMDGKAAGEALEAIRALAARVRAGWDTDDMASSA